jgi:hypothetical protein
MTRGGDFSESLPDVVSYVLNKSGEDSLIFAECKYRANQPFIKKIMMHLVPKEHRCVRYEAVTYEGLKYNTDIVLLEHLDLYLARPEGTKFTQSYQKDVTIPGYVNKWMQQSVEYTKSAISIREVHFALWRNDHRTLLSDFPIYNSVLPVLVLAERNNKNRIALIDQNQLQKFHAS